MVRDPEEPDYSDSNLISFQHQAEIGLVLADIQFRVSK